MKKNHGVVLHRNSFLNFTVDEKGNGCRVVIINPHQFKGIRRSVNKTLKNDLMFEDFPNYQLAKS